LAYISKEGNEALTASSCAVPREALQPTGVRPQVIRMSRQNRIWTGGKIFSAVVID
jgi:hypothetical protein